MSGFSVALAFAAVEVADGARADPLLSSVAVNELESGLGFLGLVSVDVEGLLMLVLRFEGEGGFVENEGWMLEEGAV